MSHAKRIQPLFLTLNIVGGLNTGIAARSRIEPTANGVSGTSSYNWSGYSAVDTTNPFTDINYSTIDAVILVPVAKTPTTGCTTEQFYSSFWVGFDGDTLDGAKSKDVLQAGVSADANCLFLHYYAWFEWFPAYRVKITNFPTPPGHIIYVFLYPMSSTAGSVNIYDLTANQGVTFQIAAPLKAGKQVTLTGDSVEWIAEAPTVNGVQTELTNYIQSPWDGVSARFQVNGIGPYEIENPMDSLCYPVNGVQCPSEINTAHFGITLFDQKLGIPVSCGYASLPSTNSENIGESGDLGEVIPGQTTLDTTSQTKEIWFTTGFQGKPINGEQYGSSSNGVIGTCLN